MKIQLFLNPVLVKELRGRMRGARAYLILTGTLILLGLVGYGLYHLARVTAPSFGGQQSAIIGQGVFIGLVFLALGIICFITPALTAGTVSGEHERKTFDMLMATPLRPASVLFGKLIASLSYVALIILAAIPLVSISYVFGGVATRDMIQALLLLFGYALTYGVIGLFFSALVRRTGLAAVLSYIVLAVFVFGTVFLYGVVGVIRQQQPPSWLLALNPFSAMASALVQAGGPDVFSMGGPIMPLLWVLGGGGFEFGMPMQMPLWRYTVGIYAWLTVALYLVSAQLVKPVRRFRLDKRAWVGIVLFVVISILAALVAYGPLSPGRIIAWLRWRLSSERELVVNGAFDLPLETAWVVHTEVERAEESGGEVTLVKDGGREVVSFSRAGDKHAETGITQVISQSVPSQGWLQLRVVLRVKSQDVQMCGIMGSECPLMLKLDYEDAGGRRHEWMQGFYAMGNPAMSSTPPFCQSCEIYQPHIQVPLDEWYTYESPNLVQDATSRGYAFPHLIRSIAVSASGHSYEAQVAEVALLVREGRPPDWEGTFLATPTPAPIMPVPVRQVPVMPPPAMVVTVEVIEEVELELPPPTPTPIPPPVPTSTSGN